MTKHKLQLGPEDIKLLGCSQEEADAFNKALNDGTLTKILAGNGYLDISSQEVLITGKAIIDLFDKLNPSKSEGLAALVTTIGFICDSSPDGVKKLIQEQVLRTLKMVFKVGGKDEANTGLQIN
jgi:hypothetical protein